MISLPSGWTKKIWKDFSFHYIVMEKGIFCILAGAAMVPCHCQIHMPDGTAIRLLLLVHKKWHHLYLIFFNWRNSAENSQPSLTMAKCSRLPRNWTIFNQCGNPKAEWWNQTIFLGFPSWFPQLKIGSNEWTKKCLPIVLFNDGKRRCWSK